MVHSTSGISYSDRQIEVAARRLMDLAVQITPKRLRRELERIVAVPGPNEETTEDERKLLGERIRSMLRPQAGPAREFAQQKVLPQDEVTRLVLAFQLRNLHEVQAYTFTEDRLPTVEDTVERVVSTVLLSPATAAVDRPQP